MHLEACYPHFYNFPFDTTLLVPGPCRCPPVLTAGPGCVCVGRAMQGDGAGRMGTCTSTSLSRSVSQWSGPGKDKSQSQQHQQQASIPILPLPAIPASLWGCTQHL
jgi:hypothetical protein